MVNSLRKGKIILCRRKVKLEEKRHRLHTTWSLVNAPTLLLKSLVRVNKAIRRINAGQNAVVTQLTSHLKVVLVTHMQKVRIAKALVKHTAKHRDVVVIKKSPPQIYVITEVDGHTTIRLSHQVVRNTSALPYVDNIQVVIYLTNGLSYFVHRHVRITIAMYTVLYGPIRNQRQVNRPASWPWV